MLLPMLPLRRILSYEKCLIELVCAHWKDTAIVVAYNHVAGMCLTGVPAVIDGCVHTIASDRHLYRAGGIGVLEPLRPIT